jgi:hypothetical protein
MSQLGLIHQNLDPHNAKSQSGYAFTYGGTAISWRSQNQTLVATSSNHAEVIDGYVRFNDISKKRLA